MQLVVRADDPAADLASPWQRHHGSEHVTRSLGNDVSGAVIVGDRLVATADIAHPALKDVPARLASHVIDALLWSGGVPTLALVQLPRCPVRVSARAHLVPGPLPLTSQRAPA